MALTDFLTTDPIAKRGKRLKEIEAQQIAVYTQIKELKRKAWTLKKEYEDLKLETKLLRKGKA